MIFAVLDDLGRVLAATTPEQWGRPTPCDGFDVAGVRKHLAGGLAYFEAVFRNWDAERPDNDPGEYAVTDDIELLLPKVAGSLRAALDAGFATANEADLGADTPGSAVVNLLLIETFTHGWDMARAIGEPWTPDAATCEHALAALRVAIKPDYRGVGMPFAPEVPAGPQASPLDRAIAFSGRDPNWKPAGA